ncbi:uncharacterised protein VP4, partial [Tai Forest reovirus]
TTTVNSFKPTYISISGSNNSIDAKALEKIDQTSKIDAALQLPVGANPSYGEFATSKDLRKFIGLREFGEDGEEIFDDMMAGLVGGAEGVAGSICSTLDVYEKVRKTANWLGAQYSRGWRQNHDAHDEIENRIERMVPAMKSMFMGTFDARCAKSGGDLANISRNEWTGVVPKELSGKADGDVRASESQVPYELFLEVPRERGRVAPYDDLIERWRDEKFILDDEDADVWDGGIVDQMAAYICFGLEFFFVVTPTDVNHDLIHRILITSRQWQPMVDSVLRDAAELQKSGEIGFGERYLGNTFEHEKDELVALYIRYGMGDITGEEFVEGMNGLDVVFITIERWRGFLKHMHFVSNWLLSAVEMSVSQDVRARGSLVVQEFRDPVRMAAFILNVGFGLSHLEPGMEAGIDERRAVDRGRLRMAVHQAASEFELKVEDLMLRLLSEGDDLEHAEFLRGLKEKATKLKEMAVGSLRTAASEKMGQVEKIMTGWVKQKASTVKQALANGIAGVFEDSKEDAEAKADVYGSMVQGRHVLALPPAEHVDAIVAYVPKDAQACALDHIDRVGHEVGMEAKVIGEVKQPPVVENHIVSEMVQRTP